MANDRWFTKRHYDMLAAEIARARRRVQRVNESASGPPSVPHSLFGLQLLEEGLNETFARDNPNFNPYRFSREIARLTYMPCPNCSDGCRATHYCDGCGFDICKACWNEHNKDAPCHV